ncbi:phosphohistidine phosphatase SixA [Methanofollis fontis]|nr:phosphohistidine phosphatase SixA [Methanofollis fontis]
MREDEGWLMDLYVLRHGKAGTPLDDPAEDAGRPLSQDGREQVKVVAGWIADRTFDLDVIATSPLRRAHETADMVARATGRTDRLSVRDELLPGREVREGARWLHEIGGDRRVMIVGHEPGLSALIGNLIGDGGASVVLRKGGIAKIRNIGPDLPLRGELHWLLTPGQIADMR